MRRHFSLTILLTLFCSRLVAASAAEPSNTVICICNHASKLMSQHKEKNAVKVLEQVFKRQPDYALARKNLAVAYCNLAIETKSTDEAIFNVHRALALFPDDTNSQKELTYVLHNGNIDVSTVDARVKYAETLQSRGDTVGSYVEYQLALQTKNDPAIQKRADELLAADDRTSAAKVGGTTAALLLSKIEIDHSDDAAFNFEYNSYVRAIERKIQSCWKAPASLGNQKVVVSFDTAPEGTISALKVVSSSGNKATDALALAAVKSACPFKPLPSDVFFEVPIAMTLDAHSDESPTLYLNGQAKPDGVRFSTGSELSPLRVPKDVDSKLQAKTDAALSQAAKVDQEIAKIEQQQGSESAKVCPKLCASAGFYLQATEYKLAEDRLKRAIAIAEKANADQEQALALSQLGSLYYTINRNADAESSLKKSIDLMQNSKEPNPALRSTLEAYAKVLYRLNRVVEANAIYGKVKALPTTTQ